MDSTNTNNTNLNEAEAAEITKEEWFKSKTETFGDAYHIWHDGLNVSGVRNLEGEEREKVLVMLHRGLEFGDGDCAKALAAMKSQDSVPLIRQNLTNAKGEEKVAFALAIHTLEPDGNDPLAETLMDVLKKGSHWSEKMQAAISLRNFSNQASERALLDAVEHDVAYLVRLHAFQSLLARWKVRADDKESKEIPLLIASPNSAMNRRDVMTEEYQKNLTEARVRLERLRDEYI